ncbi:hypothetical protein [Halobacterium litoreum]|uniref:Uncharacterized protein n=1 Tax=Halobacterium litoreum TaxID=2039234 RepID=A0ABD5NGH7_9EURY|nr:hypothetical protein [Halobacterium litoreum]UHH12965.1 hypothetical protein LT972_12475 [Halobacterium litoreum]
MASSNESDDGSFVRSRIGLQGEALLIGGVVLATLATVLYLNDNSLRFSLLAGVALGLVVAVLRLAVHR